MARTRQRFQGVPAPDGRRIVPELELEVERTLLGVLRPERGTGGDYIRADARVGARRVRLLLRLPQGALMDLGARIRAMEAGEVIGSAA